MARQERIPPLTDRRKGYPGRPSVRIHSAEDAHQSEQLAAHVVTVDTGKNTHQFECFTAGVIEIRHSAVIPGCPLARNLFRHIVEKIGRVDIQCTGNTHQTPGTDTVRTPFIFLDLLKGQTESLAQRLLRQSHQGPTQSHPRPHMYVNRIWHTPPFTQVKNYVSILFTYDEM